MEVKFKFNHEANRMEDALGISEKNLEEMVGRYHSAMKGILEETEGEPTASQLIETFVENLSKEDLSIALAFTIAQNQHR